MVEQTLALLDLITIVEREVILKKTFCSQCSIVRGGNIPIQKDLRKP